MAHTARTVHLSVELDASLVFRAGQVLGTRNPAQTIHMALEEVVKRGLRELADWRPAMTLAHLEEARQPRRCLGE
jgi:hypothetical protein